MGFLIAPNMPATRECRSTASVCGPPFPKSPFSSRGMPAPGPRPSRHESYEREAVRRMLPPPTGNATITMFGRTYVGTPGTPVDMPDQDADIAGANGWTITARQGVGATAQRPPNPQPGA